MGGMSSKTCEMTSDQWENGWKMDGCHDDDR